MTPAVPLVRILDPVTLTDRYADRALVLQRVGRLRRSIAAPRSKPGEWRARAELVELLRGIDELDDALHEARTGVEQAAGVWTALHLARLRLARVHQCRREFLDSTLLYVELLGSRPGVDLRSVVQTALHAGYNEYVQGMWAEAQQHFWDAWTMARSVRARTYPDRDDARIAIMAAERELGPELSAANALHRIYEGVFREDVA